MRAGGIPLAMMTTLAYVPGFQTVRALGLISAVGSASGWTASAKGADARISALLGLGRSAAELGSSAVIGVQVSSFGARGGMTTVVGGDAVGVMLLGTAVWVVPIQGGLPPQWNGRHLVTQRCTCESTQPGEDPLLRYGRLDQDLFADAVRALVRTSSRAAWPCSRNFDPAVAPLPRLLACVRTRARVSHLNGWPLGFDPRSHRVGVILLAAHSRRAQRDHQSGTIRRRTHTSVITWSCR